MRTACYSAHIISAALLALFALFGTACGDSDSVYHDVERIAVADQPGMAVAGETTNASFRLMDQSGKPFKAAGVDIDIHLSKHAFDTGGRNISATTDEDGVARFEFAINKADTGYILTAKSTHAALDGVPTDSRSFNVVAGPVSADTSTISGSLGIQNLSNGVHAADIIIRLLDVYENPVAGQLPTFNATGAGVIPRKCSTSDNAGVSQCEMSSTRAGRKTLYTTEPVEVYGDDLEFFWDCNHQGAPFGGGNGSEDSPYRLCSPEQLNAVGGNEAYLDKHFVVVEDIDMTNVEGFSMIGGKNAHFVGHFDGNYKRVTDLEIRDSNTNDSVMSHAGLFGVIGTNGIVKNSALERVTVYGKDGVGGFAGLNYGTLRNSYVTGSVNGEGAVGGLVGSSSGTIANAYSTATVTAERFDTGGLVGSQFDGEIRNSYSSGRIVRSGPANGGLVGEYVNGTIASSYWDKLTSAQHSSDGGTGLATLAFADSDKFIDWDFTDIWVIGTAPDGKTRPIFQWQAE